MNLSNRVLSFGLSGLLAIGIIGGTTVALAAPGDGNRPGAEERHRPGIKFTVRQIAQTCGLSREDLREGRAAGQTLAQMIEAKGGSVAECQAALLAKLDARLSEAVTNGKINEEQKTAALAKAAAAITRILNHVPTPRETS